MLKYLTRLPQRVMFDLRFPREELKKVSDILAELGTLFMAATLIPSVLNNSHDKIIQGIIAALFLWIVSLLIINRSKQ